MQTHAEAAAYTRRRINQLGLWLFLASEAFLFAAVLASRYYVIGVERPEELNLPLGLVLSLVLLLSSLTAYRAETFIATGDRRGFLRNTGFTIALGVVFLAGVGLEWNEGLRSFPPSTPYGSAFFSLIGLHAFHVVTGMAALGVVLGLGWRGRFGPDDYWGVEGVVKYWFFVELAWLFIYPTLYLVR